MFLQVLFFFWLFMCEREIVAKALWPPDNRLHIHASYCCLSRLDSIESGVGNIIYVCVCVCGSLKMALESYIEKSGEEDNANHSFRFCKNHV